MESGFLSRPHPFPEEARHAARMGLKSGLIVAFFLIVFQPFGTYEWQHPLKYLFLAGYGLITFLCIFGVGTFVRKVIAPLIPEERWTVGKEILLQSFGIGLIAVFNYLYSLWFNNRLGWDFFHWKSLAFMVWATFLIGLIPASMLTALAQIRNQKRYEHPPQPEPVSDSMQEEDAHLQLRFRADNGKEEVELLASEFLFVSASDNYVEVFFQKEKGVEKLILRGSLKRMEEENPAVFLVRCHRSYLVNLHKVERISGNAQGYKLHLPGGPVPVARSLSASVLEHLKDRFPKGKST